MPVATMVRRFSPLPEPASAREGKSTNATAATATNQTGPFLNMPAPMSAVMAVAAAAMPKQKATAAIR
jgi:hypothetical protein